MQKEVCIGINESAQIIYENNAAQGFWATRRNVGELLMLVTSELGEAMEAHRKGRMANLDEFHDQVSAGADATQAFKIHVKDTFEDEIADAIIRLLDLSGGLGIDIESHIAAKVLYNKSRPKLHGKLY